MNANGNSNPNSANQSNASLNNALSNLTPQQVHQLVQKFKHASDAAQKLGPNSEEGKKHLQTATKIKSLLVTYTNHQKLRQRQQGVNPQPNNNPDNSNINNNANTDNNNNNSYPNNMNNNAQMNRSNVSVTDQASRPGSAMSGNTSGNINKFANFQMSNGSQNNNQSANNSPAISHISMGNNSNVAMNMNQNVVQPMNNNITNTNNNIPTGNVQINNSNGNGNNNGAAAVNNQNAPLMVQVQKLKKLGYIYQDFNKKLARYKEFLQRPNLRPESVQQLQNEARDVQNKLAQIKAVMAKINESLTQNRGNISSIAQQTQAQKQAQFQQQVQQQQQAQRQKLQQGQANQNNNNVNNNNVAQQQARNVINNVSNQLSPNMANAPMNRNPQSAGNSMGLNMVGGKNVMGNNNVGTVGTVGTGNNNNNNNNNLNQSIFAMFNGGPLDQNILSKLSPQKRDQIIQMHQNALKAQAMRNNIPNVNNLTPAQQAQFVSQLQKQQQNGIIARNALLTSNTNNSNVKIQMPMPMDNVHIGSPAMANAPLQNQIPMNPQVMGPQANASPMANPMKIQVKPGIPMNVNNNINQKVPGKMGPEMQRPPTIPNPVAPGVPPIQKLDKDNVPPQVKSDSQSTNNQSSSSTATKDFTKTLIQRNILKEPVLSIPISKELKMTPIEPATLKNSKPSINNGFAIAPALASPILTKLPELNIENDFGENRIVSKRKLSELVKSVGLDEGDGETTIDGDVESILLDIADEFVNSVTTFACHLAKRRKVDAVDSKDLQFHMEKSWNLKIPGHSNDEVRNIRKWNPTSSYIQKISGVDVSRSVDRQAKTAL